MTQMSRAITRTDQTGKYGMKKKFTTALKGHRDRRRHRPRPPSEQAEADRDQEQPDEQVHSAPSRRVEVERVIAPDDEELVVEDRRQAGDHLEDSDERKHAGGEGDAAGRQAGELRVLRRLPGGPVAVVRRLRRRFCGSSMCSLSSVSRRGEAR